MKKNFLTLLFTFSLMFFGILINKVEASTNALSNVKTQSLISNVKSINKAELKKEFNNKYIKMRKVCGTKLIDTCSAQLIAATVWADWAMGVCDRNGLNSYSCSFAEGLAFYQLDYAISVCSSQSSKVEENDLPQNFERLKNNMGTAALTR